MTSTTSRSSWSTGPSRSCPNDRRRVRRIRPEPRGRSPDRRALRKRVSRGVRLRAESARPRQPVGPPRHDRVRGLGCRRGGPAVPCSRHIPGRAVLLGPRDLGRDCLRARDVVPTRPHLSDQSGLDPTAVGPRSDLRPCPRLGLLDLDDRVGHQRDVVERLRSQRPGRADLRLPRARVLRLDVHLGDALRPFVVAGSQDAESMGVRRGPPWSHRGHGSSRGDGAPVAHPFFERHPSRSRLPVYADVVDLHRVRGRPVPVSRDRAGDRGAYGEGPAAPPRARPELPGPRERAELRDGCVPGHRVRDPGPVRHGPRSLARFLKRVTNQASASKGTVIVAAGFGTFPPDQIALLRGSVDRVLEVQEAIASSTPGAEHVLMTINAQDAPVALPLVGARRGLLLTTEHPTKARLRYGARFEIVWVTDQPEAGTVCVRPKALDTEGRRAVANYAAAHEGMDIVLVGLEQLALYVDLRSWLPFVKDSLDIASLHRCRLFLTVAPEAVSSQELAMLARRFDTGLSPPTLKASPPSGPTTAAPENRIPYRGPSA